jgi:hypothetical protein
MFRLRTIWLAIPVIALVALPRGATAQTTKERPSRSTAPVEVERALEPVWRAARGERATAPMLFFLAKGNAHECGPGCDEWIAADGTIDGGTPQRLRALLAEIDKAGGRNLPVFFFSPGGSVTAAIELGRVMREHKMKAAVGRTIPHGCEPRWTREMPCEAFMRSGRELAAELRTNGAMCASACVYAFIGAAEREVAPGAGLGVHSMQVTRTMIRTNREGRIIATSHTEITGDTLSIREAHARVARYAAEMGISYELVDAAAAVPFETLRVLTRAELVRFGIDTRAGGP